MSDLLVPTHTVEAAPYETRFVGDTLLAITVADSEGVHTINGPRTVYWTHDNALTIRAYDKDNTQSFLANDFCIVTVFYRDGTIESSNFLDGHLDTLD